MSSSITGSVSGGDSDSDDSDVLDAFKKKFDNKWDPDGLITHKISALTLEEQLAYKSQIEVEEMVDKRYERLQVLDCSEQELMKAQSDLVISALKSTFQITKPEKTNVPLFKPGRETIIPNLSGSLFSAGTKIGIERLLDEKKYCKDFETIMRDQLMQNLEAINVNSFICNCAKFQSEERHCLAKYLLFAMSVCKKERVVDTIYNSLLEFRDSLTLHLKDYLDIFINWGIPEELLYPPYIFNKDTRSTNVSPDCNFEVADHNVFKVLEYISEMFDGKVHLDLVSTMTIVRVLLLMWLDIRFTTSWDSFKFGLAVKRLVEGINTDVESPENVVSDTLDLSSEHAHNHAWLVVRLLEGKTPSCRLVGRLAASRFLMRAFNCRPADTRGGLDLGRLYGLLESESEVLRRGDLYTVHVILLVVDAYLASYPTELTDRETLESFVRWARGIIFCYSDDAKCEILDRQIIVAQMKNLEIKLRCCLEDYFNADERRTIYWDRRQEECRDEDEDQSKDAAGMDEGSDDDRSTVRRGDPIPRPLDDAIGGPG